MAVEKLDPVLERTCYLSFDPLLLYNPMAQPFYADLSDTAQALQPRRQSPKKIDELLPGMDTYRSMRLLYEYCLSKSYDDVEGITEAEGRTHLQLTRLAAYCCEAGLEMARREVPEAPEYRQTAEEHPPRDAVDDEDRRVPQRELRTA